MSERVNFQLVAPEIDEDQRLIFGWASVVETKEGEIVTDLHGHIIEELELEAAVYAFMAESGIASEMHVEWYMGRLVESMMFTKEKMAKLGIPTGILPVGWWVGIRIFSQEAFDRIKAGEFKMLSIAGVAVMEDME